MTSRIIARLAGSPWLIQSEALETMLQVAGRELPDQATIDAWKNEASRRALATRAGDPLGNSPTARVRDGVAIIPIAGPIFRYANLFTEFSGATALADVAANLAAARADSRVRGIMLEIDSPGGDVTGLSEAADMIAAAGQDKPLLAYVEGSAHSAAYWLASAASRIVLSPLATIGSLGAVVAMQDSTEARARDGIRRFRFVSTQTPNKLLDPTTDAGAARVQALADRLAGEFLSAAAANRGMTVEALLAATDGGGLVVGADALAAGLADQVAGFEATLALLAKGELPARTPAPVSRASSATEPAADPSTGPAPRATSQEPSMDPMPDAPAPAPETTAQTTAPAVTQPIPVPAADAVAAERARCAAIQGAMQPGFAALAALAVSGGWPVEQFTQAQAASAEAVAQARTEAAGATFRDSLPPPVAGGGGATDAPADPVEKAKADFAASADLRAEFGAEGAYVAYVQAVAAGKVRQIRKRA
jgi:ClpP class serine protease